MILWNKTLWLHAASHINSFSQSKCIISAQQRYVMLKNVYHIDPEFKNEFFLKTKKWSVKKFQYNSLAINRKSFYE